MSLPMVSLWLMITAVITSMNTFSTENQAECIISSKHTEVNNSILFKINLNFGTKLPPPLIVDGNYNIR